MEAALDQAGIKHKISPDGTAISVPRDQVGEGRILLAGKGLLSSGSTGYELFDGQSVLGQTDAQQKVNLIRAIDGELERAIGTIDGVTSVKVLVNLPERQLFEDQPGKPTAAVTLGMGGRNVSPEVVQSVQNIVAASAPGMTPEMVAVIDKKGNLLSAANDGQLSATLADTRKTQVEADYRNRLTALIEKIVGPGNAQVEVSADLDLTSISETANVYDPDKQVVVSEQTGEENSKDSTSNSTTPVTASSNTPAGADGGGSELGSNSAGSTTSLTNYLNSSTVTTRVTQPGATKRLSVSVVVNNVPGPVDAKTGVAGPSTPRDQAQLEAIKAAVNAAMGFNAERGDLLNVSNIAFETDAVATDPNAKKPGLLAGFGKNDIMRLVELGVLAVVAVLILLLGVKPLIKALGIETKQVKGPGGMAQMPMLAGGGQGMAQMASGGQQQLAGSHGEQMAITGGQSGGLSLPDAQGGIDMARIEGQVRASSVKQVAEFVEKHPDESVSILRSWLHETA